MNPHDNRRDLPEEGQQLQPDPALNLSRGPVRSAQVWWIGIGAVFIVLLLLFGLTRSGDENVATAPQQEQQQNASPATAGSNQSPGSGKVAPP